MEKFREPGRMFDQATPLHVTTSCVPCCGATCEGCLALTGSNLCDLGKYKFGAARNNAAQGCSKLDQMEDYLIEHLMKM